MHICNGMLLSDKKGWNLTTCDMQADVEGIILTEMSQVEKHDYHVILLTVESKEQHKQKYT